MSSRRKSKKSSPLVAVEAAEDVEVVAVVAIKVAAKEPLVAEDAAVSTSKSTTSSTVRTKTTRCTVRLPTNPNVTSRNRRT